MNNTPAMRKAALWLAAVFLLGAGLGSVLGFAIAQQRKAATAHRSTGDAFRAHMLERFNQELHLSDSQRAAVDKILIELQAQYTSIHEQFEPQIKIAREKARSQIREILTPEQKPQFEDFMRRLDEERKQKGHR